MSFRAWLRKEAVKAYGVLYVLIYLDWKAEARQTEMTMSEIRNSHVEYWSETLTDALLSLGPRVGSALVTLVLVGYLYYRGRVVLNTIEGAIRRHGALRATAILAVGIGIALGWVEIAPQLPEWIQPEAVVGTEVRTP